MFKQQKNLDGVVINNVVIRIADNACIPFDPQNSDYAEYLKWLSEGNQPLPPDEPTLSE